MKSFIPLLFAAVCMILIAVSADTKKAPSIIGSWQVVRSQYGTSPLHEYTEGDTQIIKQFTGTRWSATFYNSKKRQFQGAGGGTYTLKVDEYKETVEYYSWDSLAVGKTSTFNLRIENGLLHQSGTIEYKGNPAYKIEEWFKRID